MAIVLSNKDGNILLKEMDTSNNIDHIPAAHYNIKYEPAKETIHLVLANKRFAVPKKIYGDTLQKKDTILRHYRARDDRSTGVILSGRKGTGKTLLAEALGNDLIAQDIPVFSVIGAMPAAIIRTVLRVAGPCMFYVDEYEKIYTDDDDEDDDNSDALLTLFSDASLKQALFVITCNDTTKLNGNIINRPGRFLFHFRFEFGVDKSAVDEMLNDFDIQGTCRDVLRHYILSEANDVSMDVFVSLLIAIKHISDPDEILGMFEHLNVPFHGFREWVVCQIHLNGTPISEIAKQQPTDDQTPELLAGPGKMNEAFVYFKDGFKDGLELYIKGEKYTYEFDDMDPDKVIGEGYTDGVSPVPNTDKTSAPGNTYRIVEIAPGIVVTLVSEFIGHDNVVMKIQKYCKLNHRNYLSGVIRAYGYKKIIKQTTPKPETPETPETEENHGMGYPSSLTQMLREANKAAGIKLQNK